MSCIGNAVTSLITSSARLSAILQSDDRLDSALDLITSFLLGNKDSIIITFTPGIFVQKGELRSAQLVDTVQFTCFSEFTSLGSLTAETNEDKHFL